MRVAALGVEGADGIVAVALMIKHAIVAVRSMRARQSSLFFLTVCVIVDQSTSAVGSRGEPVPLEV